MFPLYVNFKQKVADAICLHEIKIHWKKFHLIPRFKKIITEDWPKQNISFYTSDVSLPWNSNYKPGGTVFITLNQLSSTIINKDHDLQEI